MKKRRYGMQERLVPPANGSKKIMFHFYLNPDTNEWMKESALKKYIESLGMSFKEWYDDRILPKDEDGNPIIPKCKRKGCNNDAELMGISGYSDCCCYSHLVSYNESKERYIELYGPEEGEIKYKEYCLSRSQSIEELTKRLGSKEKAIECSNKRQKKRLHTLSLEGYSERYGEELGFELWKKLCKSFGSSYESYVERCNGDEDLAMERYLKACESKRWFCIDYFISKYGEEEGTRIYNERCAQYGGYITKSNDINWCIERYGKEEGTRRWINQHGGFSISTVSKVSEEFFNLVLSYLYGVIDLSAAKYGLSDEWFERTGSSLGDIKDMRFIDFKILGTNISIEFDGDRWHPNITEDDLIDFSTGVVRNMEVLNELSKRYSMLNLGYITLHIKESDYYKDPDREVQRAVKFIKDNILRRNNYV